MEVRRYAQQLPEGVREEITQQLPGGVGEEIDSAAARGSRGGDRLSICQGFGVSHIDVNIL
jgi:hypothetical protein